MHPFPLLLSLLHLIIHMYIKWKTLTLTECVCTDLAVVMIGSLTLSTVYQVYCFMFLYQLSGLCDTPRSLRNGQTSYSSTIVGSTVTYTCNTGYLRTAGSSSRTCQSNGHWSGSHPTCIRKSTLCHSISFAYWLQTCKITYYLHTDYKYVKGVWRWTTWRWSIWHDPERTLNPQSYTLVGPAPSPSAAHAIVAGDAEAVHACKPEECVPHANLRNSPGVNIWTRLISRLNNSPLQQFQ